MSAISGYLRLGGGVPCLIACAQMVAAQDIFGPDDQSIHSLDNISFGRNLSRRLPEDRFDRQPLSGGGGRHLLVADLRIDNREELSRELGIERASQARMSDADMLLAAWERWNETALDRLVGDFAFAVWDSQEQALTLARSPLSIRPLHYHAGSDFVAFATMPSGLHALPSIPKSLDFAHAAAFAAEFYPQDSSTIFEGVSQVSQGHLVRFRGSRARVRRYWKIARDELRYRNRSDYAEGLREQLDRAVSAQLRSDGGKIASQLSSGRDSSAVAATAAQILASRGKRLLAYTGAPRTDFPGPTLPGKLADESALAAEIAGLHPNMDHFICRPRGGRAFAELGAIHRLNQGPLPNLSSLSWWGQINEEASRNGASIVLTGDAGNFALSAGGDEHLVDILREKGVLRWWREAGRLAGLSFTRWRRIGNLSFGPWMPRSLYGLLLNATGRVHGNALDLPILRSPFREQMRARLQDQLADIRPPRDYYAFRRNMLFDWSYHENISLPRWGIELRDPSADRRLIQYCFSIPPEELVSAVSARPVFDSAFSDRIPRSVLTSTLRGYQAADWHEIITKEEVSSEFERYEKHSLVRTLLDFRYIRELIEKWPDTGWENRPQLYLYRNGLLSALSLANFITANFDE